MVSVKIVIAVHVSVLPIGVVLETTQDDRAAGTTAGCGAERVEKTGAVLSELVEMWRLNGRITVATGIEALVVDNKHDDVA